MARSLILGRGFIARAVVVALPAGEARFLPHAAGSEPGLLDGIDTALWGGRHPALGGPDWRLDDDLEPRFAERCAKAGIPLLTLGTRKVYAPSSSPLHEGSPIGPSDRYGAQKLSLETALLDRCGPHLTRLRLANLFGFEPGRATFMGRMLGTLARTSEIRFDMSPFTARDFIPVEAAGGMIAALLRRPPGGVVNIGSGVPLACGRLALRLIEGYGRGRLVCDDPLERDAFVLDVARAKALAGAVPAEESLEASARAVGARLAAGA